MLNRNTNRKFGFCIISSDHNVGLLKSTFYSIRGGYPGVAVICVTGADAPDAVVKEMSEICQVYKGGNTITSLLNVGFSKGPGDWNVMVMEGSHVGPGTAYKILQFATSDNDILFPIVVDYDLFGHPVNLHNNFIDGTLNGLTMHKETFKRVGHLTDNPLDVSKMFWAMDAHDKGCRFKAILGTKII